MTPWLMEFAVNNVLLSAGLAIVAFTIHRAGKSPAIAHLLWVLVLLKLVTPPVVMVPMLALPELGSHATEPLADFSGSSAMLAATDIADMDLANESSWFATYGVTTLLSCWALGSLAVLVWSLLRVIRFNRLLRQASLPVPGKVTRQAARLAQQLGIRRLPKVVAVSANVSPLIWWIGGRVKLALPVQLLQELNGEEIRWALAHELGHVRRRDYLVRWLEWLACVAFWWNPIAWLARRNLRANEEICCDALVMSTLRPRPKAYGNALLAVVEFLSAPVIRPPAVASELNSGGFLERRFRMIMSNKRSAVTPRWLTGCILLTTFCLLPLGVAYGQDYDAIQRRLGKAVGEGEITLHQANAMMAALKKSAAAGKAKSFSESDYKRAAAELQEAVEAGKLSKRQAEEKYQALRKMYAAQLEMARAATTEYEEAVRKIKAAAAAEKITEEEARLKYEALRRKAEEATEAAERRARETKQAEMANREAAAEGVIRRIKIAIESGRITEEEGRKRLEAFKREMSEQESKRLKKAPGNEQARSREVEFKQAMTMIRSAIEAGEISKEDGAKKLEAIRDAVREREKLTAERAADEARQKEKWAAVMQELEEAVKSGDLSREDAEKKLLELKERAARDRR